MTAPAAEQTVLLCECTAAVNQELLSAVMTATAAAASAARSTEPCTQQTVINKPRHFNYSIKHICSHGKSTILKKAD